MKLFFAMFLIGLNASAASYHMVHSYPQGGPKLGDTTVIEFQLFRGTDTTPLTAADLLVEHEKLIHMMCVDSGFQQYRHEHPAEISPGVWQVPVVLDTAGNYRFFLQFLPDGEITTKTVVFDDKFVENPDQVISTTPVHPETKLTFEEGEFKVTLSYPAEPEIKKILLAEFTVEKNGVAIPLQELDNYLGAKMHIAAISADKNDFVHAHPEESGVVKVYFKQTGFYGIFMQFQYKGELHTNQFALQVKPAPSRE